jgi:hypothetical protein
MFKVTKLTQLLLKAMKSTETADFLDCQDSSGNEKFSISVDGSIAISGSPKVLSYVAQVPLTAAQIIAMYTTPVSILPAPPAGTAILVEQIALELDLTATAFSGGGVVHFYYHGQTTEIMAQTIAAATVNGGAGQSIYLLEPAQTAGGSVVTPAVGIDITCASGVFAAGTGTAKVTIWYSLVTLG